MRALVLDDSTNAGVATYLLGQLQIEAEPVTDSESLLALLSKDNYDLVIVDIMMPSTTLRGLDLIAAIRGHHLGPIFVVSRFTSGLDRALALEAGAEEYMIKPFEAREFLVRVQIVLRRHGNATTLPSAIPDRMRAGGLEMDVPQHAVRLNGEPVRLTLTEFRLLKSLIQRPDSVVSTATLLREVWNLSPQDDSSVIRTTLHGLRRKLGESATKPRHIHTIAGVGIYLASDPNNPPPATAYNHQKE